jgi:N6-L-threonylcarbamoyladenine synthase
MKILGIETSCDETAAAVVEDGTKLLSSVVISQIDIHREFGGVVPEVAARSHIEVILPVIDKALRDAFPRQKDAWAAIDAIAVTKGPGLIGSLLIGTLTARTLALVKGKPLYGIHHVLGHVYANWLIRPLPKFPVLALIVSGGHSQLVLFKNHFDYKLLGQTLDDAVGEAYDKVAKVLGLPYPGGPAIDQLAPKGDPRAHALPDAKLDNPYDFSFSGLKTAALRAAQKEIGEDYAFPSYQIAERLNDKQRTDLAASFQSAAVSTMISKTLQAYKEFQPATVVIAGGVAANHALREELKKALPIKIEYAPAALCTDNAAMVAALAYFHAQVKRPDDPLSLPALPSLSI